MSSRKKLFKNNPIVGFFQYTNNFNCDKNVLSPTNPYVGKFKHDTSDISKEMYNHDVKIEKLLLYYKTLHTKNVVTRSIATQTNLNEDNFIVINIQPKKKEK